MDQGPLPAPPVTATVEEVRAASDIYADAIEAAETAAVHGLTVTISGRVLRARPHRPQGAWAVFCARMSSKSPTTTAAAVVNLLERWIEPGDHEAMYEAIADVDDFEEWTGGEFVEVAQALIQRPTSAP